MSETDEVTDPNGKRAADAAPATPGEGDDGGEEQTRVARSVDGLRTLLDRIEAGRLDKPDWVHLQGACRLDRVAQPEREELVRRLHPAVLRGFKAGNARPQPGRERLDYWRSIARNGFHDFSEGGWMKDYDSSFVESYDYVEAYLEGGLEALDEYRIYSSVLGSHDYTVEDFLATDLCADVRTIVEPMAGTAEFAYKGHFHEPGFNYVMFDLDATAAAHVMARPWLDGTEHHYVVADVLDKAIWEQTKSLTTGRSLAFIGKQSHQLFDAKQMMRLLDAATQNVDYLMIEAASICPVWDLPSVDELTRPEMKDAGFEVALIDEPDGTPNPLTNIMRFRIDAWDAEDRRTLFEYPRWTIWHPPTLTAFAALLDLNVFYLHSETDEFVAVDEEVGETDCGENPTFMIFSKTGV